MTQQIIKIIPALVGLWFTQALATDITISGTVVASPCAVDTGTKDQTVKFEQARAVNFTNVGDASEWQDFELTLSSCPVSTTQITATFTGNADNDDPTKFANAQGDATGMALQIMTRDHLTEINPLGSLAASVDIHNHQATFPLSARMYTPTGHVTAGEFNTTVQLTFTYQ
ncbi:fimbrial protein [Pluralibacter sp.]|uniref:fimbrial protein n=1 Tax=Pluralibacter sp. TaxID=1920032 RepID=UPI0025E27B0F|nr:fimbrial protein [Pluralibacter sp.]MBV8042163.1 type 1 fimbrial protein [Pluralibacter sp.]